MKLKHLELLKKLPVPFDTVVEWMNGNPPNPIYRIPVFVLEAEATTTELIKLTLDWHKAKVARPQLLLEVSTTALQTFRTRYSTMEEPGNDQSMRDLAAVTYQLICNTIAMMDNLTIKQCPEPLYYEIFAEFSIHPSDQYSTASGRASWDALMSNSRHKN